MSREIRGGLIGADGESTNIHIRGGLIGVDGKSMSREIRGGLNGTDCNLIPLMIPLKCDDIICRLYFRNSEERCSSTKQHFDDYSGQEYARTQPS